MEEKQQISLATILNYFHMHSSRIKYLSLYDKKNYHLKYFCHFEIYTDVRIEK
jgi:hypothetical protein